MELVNVVDRPGKGRSLVAACHFKAGEVALVSEALVLGVFPSQASNCCAYCLRRRPVILCPSCAFFGYCSEDCRKADASDHVLECPAVDFLNVRLRAAGDHVWHGGDAVLNAILLARLVRARLPQRSAAAQLASPFAGKPKVLHAALPTPKLEIPKVTAEVTLAANAEFPGFLPKWWLDTHKPFVRVEALVGLLMQIQVNSIGVVETERFEAVGEGLFVEGALANHDCSPNCHFTFRWESHSSRPTLHLQCVRDVTPGEDLVISYHDTAQAVWQRRRRLQGSHWFTCRCVRCLQELNREDLPNQAKLVGDKEGRVLRSLLGQTVADMKEEAMVLEALRVVGVSCAAESAERQLEAALAQIQSPACDVHPSSNLSAVETRARLRKSLRALQDVIEVSHPDASIVFELRCLVLSRAQFAGDASIVADMTKELVATCGRVYHSFDTRRCALLELRRQALQSLGRVDEEAAVAACVQALRGKFGQELRGDAERNAETVAGSDASRDAEKSPVEPVNAQSTKDSIQSNAEWVPGDRANRKSASIRIALPDIVNSMADVELDISSETVKVAMCNGGLLHEFSTPFAIDVAEAQAVFSRKSHTLKVIVCAS